MEQTEPNYETAKEAGDRWGVSARLVRKLARDGRIPGAALVENWQGKVWLIPRGAVKPERAA